MARVRDYYRVLDLVSRVGLKLHLNLVQLNLAPWCSRTIRTALATARTWTKFSSRNPEVRQRRQPPSLGLRAVGLRAAGLRAAGRPGGAKCRTWAATEPARRCGAAVQAATGPWLPRPRRRAECRSRCRQAGRSAPDGAAPRPAASPSSPPARCSRRPAAQQRRQSLVAAGFSQPALGRLLAPLPRHPRRSGACHVQRAAATRWAIRQSGSSGWRCRRASRPTTPSTAAGALQCTLASSADSSRPGLWVAQHTGGTAYRWYRTQPGSHKAERQCTDGRGARSPHCWPACTGAHRPQSMVWSDARLGDSASRCSHFDG